MEGAMLRVDIWPPEVDSVGNLVGLVSEKQCKPDHLGRELMLGCASTAGCLWWTLLATWWAW